jgi:hypothetical protein
MWTFQVQAQVNRKAHIIGRFVRFFEAGKPATIDG